jgi:hypothetical protein
VLFDRGHIADPHPELARNPAQGIQDFLFSGRLHLFPIEDVSGVAVLCL